MHPLLGLLDRGLQYIYIVKYRSFWNATLITNKSKYYFGVLGMTISENLGLNQRENTLSGMGNLLAFILDTIDKDHCKKSIRIR